MADIRLYGIRHHGAGSCRNMLAALADFEPDILLIECPSDAESLVRYVALDMVDPPAAIMAYNPKDLNQYAYYPFTIFSPEWQAIQFGNNHEIPVRFFDLPQSQSFLLSDNLVMTKKERGFTNDPFGHMALLAGYTDPERWWEDYVEQQNSAPDIFETILELMKELRGSDLSDKKSNVIREAYMRTQMRIAVKEGHQKIAVVCGAWHTPALVNLGTTTQSADNLTLKGLKKTPVAFTWIPWSYNRIARHTGYGSGVISPYWYEALFTDPDRAIARWMSRASTLLQELGHQISPAQTIEGTRLAESLAYIRKKAMPGINELFDAVIAVYTQGNDQTLEQLKVKLLEGEKIGMVSEQIPTVPLLRDLEDQIKKVRLSRDWKKTGEIEKHLDLRKPIQLEASRLLHRLKLLGIDWGEPKEVEHDPLGTFHEYWDLEWFPEFELQIIEASMWGNTVYAAAHQFILDHLEDDSGFEDLGLLLYQTLHADIPDLILPISRKISDLGNLTDDVLALMKIIPPLIWSLRYGNTAQLDTSGIKNLIDQLFPRICILLPAKVKSISEEVAQDTFETINEVHQAIQILDDHSYHGNWISSLYLIATTPDASALVKGGAIRLLMVKEHIPEEELYTMVRYNLSSLLDPFYACYFLEGLVYGGGWLLIHKEALRHIIDQWLMAQTEEQFIAFLPILRRTFSTFSVEEKEAIYDLLSKGKFVKKEPFHLNNERKGLILPTIKEMLSVKSS